MSRLRPHPVGCLFRGHAYVIKPALINENRRAICTGPPRRSGNRVKERAEFSLARSQSVFRLFSVLNVRDKSIPVKNFSLGVVHGDHADLKPAVYAIGSKEAI